MERQGISGFEYDGFDLAVYAKTMGFLDFDNGFDLVRLLDSDIGFDLVVLAKTVGFRDIDIGFVGSARRLWVGLERGKKKVLVCC